MKSDKKISHPVVSVIMPSYNAEKYVAQAIQSVQKQTLTDWELLVIDNASGDDTPRIVADFAQKDPRIRLYRNEENVGVARSRNKGLALAKGDYIAFLDSDDLWRPRKLELQVELAEQKNAELVYCSYAIIDETGCSICSDFIVPPSTDYDGLLKMNLFGCSAVMVSRSAMKGFSFPEDCYHEDYALWLLLLRAGKCAAGHQQVLADYRVRAGSRNANKCWSALQRWKIYRSLLGLSLGRSVFYSVRYIGNGLRKYRPLRN